MASNYVNKNNTLVIEAVYIDMDKAWIRVIDRGRACYIIMDSEKVYELMDKGAYEENRYIPIRDYFRNHGVDILKKHHIENVFPATKFLWEEVVSSETGMCFIYPHNEDIWQSLGITRKEFEAQVDADIMSYGLENSIVKNKDDALYTCNSNLQSIFTEAV